MTPRFVLSGITLKPTAAIGTYRGYLLSVAEGAPGRFTATAAAGRSIVSTEPCESMLGAIEQARALVDQDIGRIHLHGDRPAAEPAVEAESPAESPVESGRKKPSK